MIAEAPTLAPVSIRCSLCQGTGIIRDFGPESGCIGCNGTGVKKREARHEERGLVHSFSVPSRTDPHKTYRIHYFSGRCVCNCLGHITHSRCDHADKVIEAMSNAVQDRPGTDLATRTNAPPQALTVLRPAASLLPSMDDITIIKTLSNMAARARGHAIPAHIDTPEKAAAIMIAGLELGLRPMTSLRHMYVINGRTEPDAQAMMGIVRANDPTADFQFPEYTQEAVTCVLRRSCLAAPVTVRYSVDDAKKSGQIGKQGPWQSFTRDMLGWNSVRRCCKLGAAELINAIHVRVDDVETMIAMPQLEDEDPVEQAAIPASAYNPGDLPTADELADARLAEVVDSATEPPDEFATDEQQAVRRIQIRAGGWSRRASD